MNFGCGGGVVGKISSVCSNLCCCNDVLGRHADINHQAQNDYVHGYAVTNGADRPSGSGSKPKRRTSWIATHLHFHTSGLAMESGVSI